MKERTILLVVLSILTIALIGCEEDLYISQSDINSESQNEQNDDNINESSDNEINFVSKELFEIIKNAYSEVDFIGEFQTGTVEVYGFYKEQYLKLLKCEVTFIDKSLQKNFYINEFNEMDFTHPGYNSTYDGMKESYDPNNYLYYFFDVDGDGPPELCVSDETRFIYIFKYDPNSGEIVLWHEIFTTWIRLLGSKKLWLYSGGTPVEYAYFLLDENGEEECSVRFYLEGYKNIEKQQDDTLYMVALPEYADKSKNIELLDKYKNQAVFDPLKSIHYFRVTEEQWIELTEIFFESRELAKENIIQVSFTFEQLFGGYYLEKYEQQLKGN